MIFFNCCYADKTIFCCVFPTMCQFSSRLDWYDRHLISSSCGGSCQCDIKILGQKNLGSKGKGSTKSESWNLSGKSCPMVMEWTFFGDFLLQLAIRLWYHHFIGGTPWRSCRRDPDMISQFNHFIKKKSWTKNAMMEPINLRPLPFRHLIIFGRAGGVRMVVKNG